jgi:hypothetical protein
MNPILLFDIDYTLINVKLFWKPLNIEPDWKKANLPYRDAVYKEVPEVLEKLSKKFQLGIYSEGDENFQLKKLQKGNLLQFFTKKLMYIHISKKNTLEQIKQISRNDLLWFIDDRLDNLDSVHTTIPEAKTVRIVRGYYRRVSYSFKPDYSFSSLKPLIRYLDRVYN